MRYIDLIGVPSGVGVRMEGACDGPDGFSAYGIERRLAAHLGSAFVVRYRNLRERWEYDTDKEYVSATLDPKEDPVPPVYYQAQVEAIAKRSAAEVFRSLRVGNLPVILGGDHSVSIGTIPEFVRFAMREGKRVGLLWPDAHFDGHTERTSHSHNANGMPLAAILGHGLFAQEIKECIPLRRNRGKNTKRPVSLKLRPSQILHLGGGEDDCEQEERDFFDREKIARIDAAEFIAKGGAEKFTAIFRAFTKKIDVLAVSLDLDVFHTHWAPGVSYPRRFNGLLRNEGFFIADLVRECGKLGHLEIMEYNPRNEKFDPAGMPRTAEFATELLCRMFK